MFCGFRIGRRHDAGFWVPAFVCGLAFFCAYGRLGLTPPLLLWLAIGFFLTAVGASDIKSMRVPDEYVILLAGLGALWQLLARCVPGLEAIPLWDMPLGVLCGAAPLLLADLAARRIWKREGFGLGDVKLMGACGLFLGWKLSLLALAAGVILGGLAADFFLFRGKASRAEYLPFAPFLGAGVLLAGLWGESFLRWFFHAAW